MGAIVIVYGVMFAFIGFFVSILAAYYIRERIIVIRNRIMAIILFIAIGISTYRFMDQKKSKNPANVWI